MKPVPRPLVLIVSLTSQHRFYILYFTMVCPVVVHPNREEIVRKLKSFIACHKNGVPAAYIRGD